MRIANKDFWQDRIGSNVDMEQKQSADVINSMLRKIQNEWYTKLTREYPHFICKPNEKNAFSSPFCCGVSAREWNQENDLIMYVGEEARDWWFDDEEGHSSDISYLQEYAVAYFEIG